MYVYGNPVEGSVCSVVAVQVPRGRFWNSPLSPPVLLQPSSAPSTLGGTPISDDTTATCRSGRPPASSLSTSMNTEKLLIRSFCEGVMDDELSIMNSRSSLRFAVAGERTLVTSEPGVQPADRPTSRAARPPNAPRFRLHPPHTTRPTMRTSSGRG